MEEIDISKFNAETLHHLVKLAVPIKEDPELFYTSPDKQAEERGVPIISKWPLDGDRLNRHSFIVGIEAKKSVIPFKIHDFICAENFEITKERVMFETPLFTETLGDMGYNPYATSKKMNYDDVNFLVMTLPPSLRKKCGDWWKCAVSDEEFTILPDFPKIRYSTKNYISVVREGDKNYPHLSDSDGY